jgi:hypothetical protein
MAICLKNMSFCLVRRLHQHEPFFDVPVEGAGSPSAGYLVLYWIAIVSAEVFSALYFFGAGMV